MPHEVSQEASEPVAEFDIPVSQPSAVARVVFGTVLALGTFLASQALISGATALTSPNPAAWRTSPNGLIAIQVAQALAVVFGAVIAAAGRSRGYWLGLTVGILFASLLAGHEFLNGAPREVVFFARPAVLAVLGMIGGAVGAMIWKAAPQFELPVTQHGKQSSICLAHRMSNDRKRPISWLKILAGAGLIVLGVVVAEPVREYAQKYSGGVLRVESRAQGEFITFQLAVLALILGGAIAGAGTGAGILHGLLTGLIGGTTVFAFSITAPITPLPIEFLITKLQLDDVPFSDPGVVGGIVGCIAIIAIFGGWLGGALFPPLAPEYMRRRAPMGMD